MNLWTYISNLGVRSTDSSESLRKIHLVNQVCFLGTLTTLIFVAHIYSIGCLYYFPIQICTGVLMSLCFFFNARRHYYFSLYWMFSVLIANIFYCSLEIPGSGVEYFLIPIGLIPFTVIDNKKICISVIAVTFVVFFSSYFLRDVYQPHQPIAVFPTRDDVCCDIKLSIYFVLYCYLSIQKRKRKLRSHHYPAKTSC